MRGKTEIKKLYLASPSGGWPVKNYDPAADIKMFDAELAELQSKLDRDVEFVGGELIKTQSDLEKLREDVTAHDGILAFNMTSGSSGLFTTLVNFGAPTLLFFQPFSGHNWNGVADLRRSGKKVDVLATSDLSEVAEKVKLFDAIRRLKETKILYVKNGGVSEDYATSVKEKFGVEIKSINHQRLVETYMEVDEKEAEAGADEWIDNAERVEPERKDITDASRMYIAIKKIMEEENANTITINCLGLALPAYPCLAFAKLNNEGLTAVCEADLPSTLTQLIIAYLANKPGYISDPVIDTATNTIIHSHCIAPTKMDGPAGKAAPYVIQSHHSGKSASLRVRMRVGQVVTVAKLVDLDKMLISTGEITGNPETVRGCRTKVATKVSDAKKILYSYSGGLHRVVFYGDYVEQVRALGQFLGYEVVEEG